MDFFKSRAKKKKHVLNKIANLTQEKKGIGQDITELQNSDLLSINTFLSLKDIRLRKYAVDARLDIEQVKLNAL